MNVVETESVLPAEYINLGEEFEVELAGKKGKTKVHEFKGYKNMDLQLELQATLVFLLKDEDKFSEIFYAKVFEKAPSLRKLFKSNMIDQGRLLTHMIGGIVYSLARPEYLELGLKRLGKNHQGYGVREENYPIVKEAILETIPEMLGEYYTEQAGEAWSQAMDFVIGAMKSGVTEN